MPRVAYHSNSLAAAVRAHFGLTQAELAGFIGVGRPHLAMHEAGRKSLGPGPDQRLQVLARQLPPPDGHGAPAPAFGPTAPDPATADLLHQRLARCRWLRTRLAYGQERQRGPGQARHQRRLWAVQVQGPALAHPLPLPDWLAPGGPALPLPPYPLATPDAARDTYWLSGLALRLAATTPPLPPAQAALAEARRAGLDAEIAALEASLGRGG